MNPFPTYDTFNLRSPTSEDKDSSMILNQTAAFPEPGRSSEHGGKGWGEMSEYHLIRSRSLHVATLTHGPGGGFAK